MSKGLLKFKKIKEDITDFVDNYSLSNEYERDKNNLIIGENYFALDYLVKKSEKFDIIYIDPPYNTGSKDFKYNDKYVERDDEDRHSRWLSFMDRRLSMASKLIADKGCLILSIGEDEVHHIALLLKDHFKFVSEPIIWQSKANGNNNKSGRITSISTEFVFIAYNYKGFKTNEELVDLNSKSEYADSKIKRYPLGIFIKKELSSYPLREYNGD